MPEAVTVRLEWREIPTYVPGPASPYPAYAWARRRQCYPYSVMTDLSTESRPVKHRVVVLENQYVRVEVMPDLGGHVHSLFDKVHNQEVFMAPPTVKYQNVSARGAWIAGGIEFNYGHRGHTVNSVSPVSWTMRQEPDGSASVWVGSVSRMMESRWTVKISLKPGRQAMDLDIHSMGPAALPGMMYWWSNSAVEVNPDCRFYYFGAKAHAGGVTHSWPITDGLDYTWYKNRYVGADMFLLDGQRDYLGFYDFGKHAGLAQTADLHRAPGQKYFTWGTDQRGRYWDQMLSDSGQTYAEIQRGRVVTQGTPEPIPAMSVDSWSETWLPINGTEGFSAVENDTVLSVDNQPDHADIRIASAVPRAGLTVEAMFDAAPLGRWTIDSIAPGKLFSQRVALTQGQRCNRVRISDAAGAILLDWEEFRLGNDDWYKEEQDKFNADAASDDELFQRAEFQRFENWPNENEFALGWFERVLKNDPGHAGALRSMAEYDLYAGRHDQAIERLTKTLTRSPIDVHAQTLLGWAQLRSGKIAAAVTSFATAGRYEPGRRNGLFGLACAYLAAANFAKAESTAQALLADCPADRWGRWALAVACRKLGKTDQGQQIIAQLVAEDPLWSRATAEAFLLGMPAKLGDGSRKLADDSVTSALPYLELGLWQDAAAILSLAEWDEPFSDAIRLSHLAYAHWKAGDTSAAQAALAKLESAAPEQANPWATASLAVLSELAKAAGPLNASPRAQAMLHMMLGNLLASRTRIEEAQAAWKQAIELGLQSAIAHRNLAIVAVHRGQKDAALDHYRKAWSLSHGDVNLFVEFDRFLGGRGLHEERLAVYQQLPVELHKRSMVATRHVHLLLDLQRYEEALAELETRDFLTGEFERTIRLNFVEALVALAMRDMAAGRFTQAEAYLRRGLTYPRNLNTGRHYSSPEEAQVLYLLGLLYEMAGRPEQAKENYLSAACELHYDGDPQQSFEMFAWMALGHRPRAASLAHKIEQLARGDKPLPFYWYWWYGKTALHWSEGLVQLFKGRTDAALAAWKKALDEEPDARNIRVYLNAPRELLDRMARKITGPMK